ncbi:glycoside hydrolase family 76 protein [Planoprotostelium fungivorum]|uniref:Glycoside hydrolase family 76 protein n=1 Tax=Planoprotostelium fungivorum TaxID=1890364 RepID=A0A2P6N8R1_9EUKA|nr:glycoside hydrolase family 76 protein [Planoprotostelium fungivorum]
MALLGQKEQKSYYTIVSSAVTHRSTIITRGCLPDEFGMGSWVINQSSMSTCVCLWYQLQILLADSSLLGSNTSLYWGDVIYAYICHESNGALRMDHFSPDYWNMHNKCMDTNQKPNVTCMSKSTISEDLYAAVDGLYSLGFDPEKVGWQTALAYTAYIDAINWRQTFGGRDLRLDHSLSRTRAVEPNNIVQNDWNDDAGWWGVMAIRYHETFGDTSTDGQSSYNDNIDVEGGDLPRMPIYARDAGSCMRLCTSNPNCQSWAHDKCGHNCWLKKDTNGQHQDNCRVSGKVSKKSTGANHLEMAQNIWEILNPRWILPPGQCGAGGMIEKQDDNYISAIASSLNTVLSAKLYYHTNDAKYLNAAEASLKYVETLRMSDCIADGRRPTGNDCKLSESCFTYNSGIYIMGLAALAQATGDMSHWKNAYNFSVYTIKRRDWIDDHGILKNGVNCDDGLCFSSQLVRGISYLMDVSPSDPQNKLMPFLAAQMNGIRKNDRQGDTYGPQWQGPLSTPKMCTQQCALSGLFGGYLTPNVTTSFSFSIWSVGSNLVLSGSSDGGVTVRSFAGQEGQKYNVKRLGNRFYNIQAVGTDKCLTLGGNGNGQGASLSQCSKSDQQAFRLQPSGSGSYELFNKFSGKYMDTGCHDGEGSFVYQWDRASVSYSMHSRNQGDTSIPQHLDPLLETLVPDNSMRAVERLNLQGMTYLS